MPADDSTQIGAIAAYLKHTCNVPESQIKLEYNVLFSDDKLVGIFKHITPNILSGRPTSVNKPDIIITNDDHTRIVLIIELDGSIHDHPEFDRGRTMRRNANYEKHKIPLCVINIADFKKAGKPWWPALRADIRRHLPDL